MPTWRSAFHIPTNLTNLKPKKRLRVILPKFFNSTLITQLCLFMYVFNHKTFKKIFTTYKLQKN